MAFLGVCRRRGRGITNQGRDANTAEIASPMHAEIERVMIVRVLVDLTNILTTAASALSRADRRTIGQSQLEAVEPGRVVVDALVIVRGVLSWPNRADGGTQM